MEQKLKSIESINAECHQTDAEITSLRQEISKDALKLLVLEPQHNIVRRNLIWHQGYVGQI